VLIEPYTWILTYHVVSNPSKDFAFSPSLNEEAKEA
jgi:hypothetical protein